MRLSGLLRRCWRALPLCALLAGLVACGGHSNSLPTDPDRAAAPAPATPGATGAAGGAVGSGHGRLSTSFPDLHGLPAGSEFEFVLAADFAEPVFQGSARILFDSALVEPVDALPGGLLPADEVVLARADLPAGTLALSALDRPAALDGCVPFAFTGRPGTAPLPPGHGELLRIRFRLRVASPAGIPVRLQDDPEFLQLRDAAGHRLSFDLAREVAAR